MGKLVTFEYDSVKNFSKGLDRKSKHVDRIFVNVCDRAMENTLTIAEERSLVFTGELKESWRRDVKAVEHKGKRYIKTAVNKAYNERAVAAGMEGHYASFIEEGHKEVPWRVDTHAVPMLTGQAGAEIDTERKLQGIIEDEMTKFFGRLFN